MTKTMQPFPRSFTHLFKAVALSALLVFAATASVAGIASTSSQASAAVVRSINVQGNQRVDADTIRSYVTIKPGRSFSSFDTDESLQALFATGLFSDVRINQRGNTLIVEVKENPVINLVRFEGNEKVKDAQLARIVQSQSLGIFDQEKLQSDIERVREAVRRSGRASSRVSARVDQLDNNRVDVVFTIAEGDRTKIADINFVGNNAYGDRRLTEIISHNESNFLSWLRRDDIYDEDRLRADEERLRNFYFNRGYADFRVISAVGELDDASNTYTITITVDEGERYRFGDVQIDNSLPQVDTERVRDAMLVVPGETYSARKVERSLVAMTETIAASGYSFAEVTPRGDRDFENRTINITFFVDEGPRTYIDRIDVVGNTRTRGYVIRREFDVSEGDAYNKVLINRAKRRLEALGFFERVRITTRPGSAPDRVNVIVDVVDKSTGNFSIGGGYSTEGGALGEISVSESNFLGRGQYLKISGGFGEDNTKYAISFTEPYFLGHRLAVGFDLSQETANASDSRLYDNEVTIARLRASAALTQNLRAQVNYTFKREELSIPVNEDGNANNNIAVSSATQDAIDRSPYVTSSLGYALTYSTIDNIRNPREGLYAKLTQDFAGVGGDAQFVKTEGKISAYYLASEDADIVLLGSLSGGNIFDFGNDGLRLNDHFFKGGETVRGFETRGFGPRDSATNEVLGGTLYGSATVEVQFPIGLLPRSYGIRGALFADAGILTDTEFSGSTVIDTGELRASVGASIIWDSPFGPLRGDLAYPIAKEDHDEEQMFRFGVSTNF